MEITFNIQKLINEAPTSFEDCMTFLRKVKEDSFTNLVPEGNPVVQNLDKFNKEQVGFTILEYAQFSNEAIHMLLDAMLRNHDWESLREELQENIDEEKGSETKYIPHLEMMRRGYLMDLGLDTDNHNCTLITQNFLNRMRKIFKHNDNAYSAGALLAFEGTAIKEFHILEDIVNKYCELDGRTLDPNSLTKLYIIGHKEFEIGHEEHLKQSIAPHINSENIGKMVKGYLKVCMTMSAWWEQMAIESHHFFADPFLDITLEDTFEPEIEKVFN
jgi:hypothetical protein